MEKMKETSLVIIKPDGVERKLVGKIIQRFEDKGIDLLHLKFERLTVETVKEHYEHLKDELFFPELLAYMTSGLVVVMVVVGDNVVKKVRKLVGATNPLDAESGTLRADYGLSVTKNLIHASDSVQSAKIEMQRFFG
ncbi:nucleoside-diphosphate kinase [Enterococcus faecalis]|nr:nucleoside-diphosphate kinase [Enterococcus faecalis]